MNCGNCGHRTYRQRELCCRCNPNAVQKMKEQQKEWRKNNADKLKEYQKTYRNKLKTNTVINEPE